VLTFPVRAAFELLTFPHNQHGCSRFLVADFVVILALANMM
jgi:hypothetical protein